MAALERDLERVLADEGHVLDAELVRSECREAREAPRGSRLTATFRARARPPQPLTCVLAAVAALPLDLHDLAFAVDVDVQRKGVGIFQLYA